MKLPRLSLLRKKINDELTDHMNDTELSELVKSYQVNALSRTYWVYNNNECWFLDGPYILRRQSLQNRLLLDLVMMKCKVSQ